MGLAQDCEDLRNGYVTHRELNERDGLYDDEIDYDEIDYDEEDEEDDS